MGELFSQSVDLTLLNSELVPGFFKLIFCVSELTIDQGNPGSRLAELIRHLVQLLLTLLEPVSQIAVLCRRLCQSLSRSMCSLVLRTGLMTQGGHPFLIGQHPLPNAPQFVSGNLIAVLHITNPTHTIARFSELAPRSDVDLRARRLTGCGKRVR